MAYPTVAGPYGLQPINLVGGQVYAGQVRQIPIASDASTDIFYGDIVALNTSGNLVKVTTTDAATNAIGVFLGCSYTNPATQQPLFYQCYNGPVTASDIKAFVQDDPDQLYKVAVVSATTTISGVTRAAVGQNAALVQNTGSTITGDSKVALKYDIGNTSTFLPLRLVDFVNGPFSTVGDAYTDCIVKFNFGIHSYYSATGV